MITKKDFVTYMSHVYGPSNMYTDLYRTFKDIQNITDKVTINKLHEIGYMVGKQRKLYYREVLANNGKELTPELYWPEIAGRPTIVMSDEFLIVSTASYVPLVMPTTSPCQSIDSPLAPSITMLETR